VRIRACARTRRPRLRQGPARATVRLERRAELSRRMAGGLEGDQARSPRRGRADDRRRRRVRAAASGPSTRPTAR
jgi:hypothetical protein